MATILDTVRALRSKLKLGNSTRIDTLVLDPRTPAAVKLVDTVAGPLRAAARAHRVVVEPATADSGVADIFVGVVA